jgi:septal ring factor EnvC (AmiA/AmiB activator)
VTKIWDEQQKKYDALKEKFDALEQTLANQELDEDATKELTDFKTELQAFDDTIPDLENPPAPETVRSRR